MEAKELRIGNYVDWNGELALVSQLLEMEAVFKCGDIALYSDLVGITLTKDWLKNTCLHESFGGGKKWFAFSENDWLKVKIQNNGNSIYFYWGKDIMKNIEYVHQLQNLYFALTQTELTITPKGENK